MRTTLWDRLHIVMLRRAKLVAIFSAAILLLSLSACGTPTPIPPATSTPISIPTTPPQPTPTPTQLSLPQPLPFPQAPTGNPAPLPTWEPGQFWQSRIGSGSTIAAQDRFLRSYVVAKDKTSSGDLYLFINFELLPDGTPVDVASSYAVPDFWTAGVDSQRWHFPMDVGASWISGQFDQRDLKSTVSSFETVVTDTGVFDAFRVDRETPSGQLTEWYSSDVGFVIKAAVKDDPVELTLSNFGNLSPADALDEIINFLTLMAHSSEQVHRWLAVDPLAVLVETKLEVNQSSSLLSLLANDIEPAVQKKAKEALGLPLTFDHRQRNTKTPGLASPLQHSANNAPSQLGVIEAISAAFSILSFATWLYDKEGKRSSVDIQRPEKGEIDAHLGSIISMPLNVDYSVSWIRRFGYADFPSGLPYYPEGTWTPVLEIYLDGQIIREIEHNEPLYQMKKTERIEDALFAKEWRCKPDNSSLLTVRAYYRFTGTQVVQIPGTLLPIWRTVTSEEMVKETPVTLFVLNPFVVTDFKVDPATHSHHDPNPAQYTITVEHAISISGPQAKGWFTQSVISEPGSKWLYKGTLIRNKQHHSDVPIERLTRNTPEDIKGPYPHSKNYDHHPLDPDDHEDDRESSESPKVVLKVGGERVFKHAARREWSGDVKGGPNDTTFCSRQFSVKDLDPPSGSNGEGEGGGEEERERGERGVPGLKAQDYIDRGNDYYNQGDYEAALAAYGNALELATTDAIVAIAHHNRGLAHHALGNPYAAIEAFTQAIRVDPEFALAYYYRATVYETQGNARAAIGDFTEFLDLYTLDDEFSDYARQRIE